MSREFVSTKNALGRTRTYRFEHCGSFTVWANPMEAKRSKPAPDRMVVFDYSGPERLPLLAGPNKRVSGGNAFINAGYGLDAREKIAGVGNGPNRAQTGCPTPKVSEGLR